MKSAYSDREKVVRGSIMAVSLFTGMWLVLSGGAPVFLDQWKRAGEVDMITPADAVAVEYHEPNAFCLEGEVMQQLMQGFGSEEIAREVQGSRLNCEARVIREQIVDGVAVLDVEVVCECQDDDCGNEATDSPKKVVGEWQFTMN